MRLGVELTKFEYMDLGIGVQSYCLEPLSTMFGDARPIVFHQRHYAILQTLKCFISALCVCDDGAKILGVDRRSTRVVV